jgi:hypothetical protein
MSFPTTVYIPDDVVTTTSSTQQFPLGTRGCAQDGRVFRYAQAGPETDLKAYMLCITIGQNGASTATDQWLLDDYAVGSTYVQIGLGTMSSTEATYPRANFFKDGYLYCNSTDILYNQICRIDSHPQLASGSCTSVAALAQGIYLKFPGLKKAGETSTSCWCLAANPYKFVKVSTDANGPGTPVGVTPCAVTKLYYFWLQTWGPSLAHAGEGVSASIDKLQGAPVYWSTGSTGGVCRSLTASASGFIAHDTDSGFALTAGKVGSIIIAAPAANFFHMINLSLAP